MKRYLRPGLSAILLACPTGRWFWATEVIGSRPQDRTESWARIALSKLCRMGILESRNVTERDLPRPGGCYRLYRVCVPLEAIDWSPSGLAAVAMPDVPATAAGGAP